MPFFKRLHPLEISVGHRVVRYWLPVIGLCALIFIQSSFPALDTLPRWPFFDKVLHAIGYGVLGALVCRALNSVAALHAKWAQLLLWGVILTSLYGLSDEWHQSFVPDRTASTGDLVADVAGALFGCLIWSKFASRPPTIQ